MPLVNLEPKTPEIEEELAFAMPSIRRLLKAKISDISEFPKNDVLVGLLRCPYRDPDPAAAEIIIFADTCPHKDLEEKSNMLLAEVAQLLIEMGYTLSDGNTAEVWIRFLPGPWGQIRNGKLAEIVPHPRQ